MVSSHLWKNNRINISKRNNTFFVKKSLKSQKYGSWPVDKQSTCELTPASEHQENATYSEMQNLHSQCEMRGADSSSGNKQFTSHFRYCIPWFTVSAYRCKLLLISLQTTIRKVLGWFDLLIGLGCRQHAQWTAGAKNPGNDISSQIQNGNRTWCTA